MRDFHPVPFNFVLFFRNYNSQADIKHLFQTGLSKSHSFPMYAPFKPAYDTGKQTDGAWTVPDEQDYSLWHGTRTHLFSPHNYSVLRYNTDNAKTVYG